MARQSGLSSARARVFRHRALLEASRILPTRTQNPSKIDPKWYHLASKKRPKWYLSDPEASNLPYNRFYDSELGS